MPTHHNQPTNARVTHTRTHLQMEYCASTLRGLIDSGRLHASLPECWRLLRQILQALDYL